MFRAEGAATLRGATVRMDAFDKLLNKEDLLRPLRNALYAGDADNLLTFLTSPMVCLSRVPSHLPDQSWLRLTSMLLR